MRMRSGVLDLLCCHLFAESSRSLVHASFLLTVPIGHRLLSPNAGFLGVWNNFEGSGTNLLKVCYSHSCEFSLLALVWNYQLSDIKLGTSVLGKCTA
jgi:hypothetical protein